jgi:hypothetical protein
MKSPLFLLFIFLSFNALSNESIEKDRLIESKIEEILNSSNLTLSQKTAVQTLAFEKLEEQKKASNGQPNIIEEKLTFYQQKSKEYTALTSAVAFKMVELSSEVGISADKFIQESWIGKGALLLTFYKFGGHYAIDIIVIISLAFVLFYFMNKLIFNCVYDKLSFAQDDYKTLNVKKGKLGMMFSSEPTKEIRVPLLRELKEDYDDNPHALFWIYLFSVIVTPIILKLFSLGF